MQARCFHTSHKSVDCDSTSFVLIRGVQYVCDSWYGGGMYMVVVVCVYGFVWFRYSQTGHEGWLLKYGTNNKWQKRYFT